MEQRGVLLSWDDDKGFGFIQPQDGGPKLFVHISAMRGDARPNQGDAVFYLAGKDDQGRMRATHMRGEGLSIDRPAIRRKPREPAMRQPARKKGRPAVTSTAARVRRPSARRTSAVQHQIPKLMLWLAWGLAGRIAGAADAAPQDPQGILSADILADHPCAPTILGGLGPVRRSLSVQATGQLSLRPQRPAHAGSHRSCR